MRLDHSAVTSSVFALVKTVELDIQLGDDSVGKWTARIEIFQDTEKPDHFRCHYWELESFRLTPTLPMDESGQPREITDDGLMVERHFPQRQVDYGDFVASSTDAALAIVITGLKTRLEHVTGEPAL